MSEDKNINNFRKNLTNMLGEIPANHNSYHNLKDINEFGKDHHYSLSNNTFYSEWISKIYTSDYIPTDYSYIGMVYEYVKSYCKSSKKADYCDPQLNHKIYRYLLSRLFSQIKEHIMNHDTSYDFIITGAKINNVETHTNNNEYNSISIYGSLFVKKKVSRGGKKSTKRKKTRRRKSTKNKRKSAKKK